MKTSFQPERDPAEHDADWRAFRYIAGEMTDAERDAFEAELADELAVGELVLSEAVTRAIAIGQTVQVAETQVVAAVTLRSKSAWRTRLSWLAAGVLAGAAAIALATPALRWFDADRNVATADPQTAKLAEVWSETSPLSFSAASEDDDSLTEAEVRSVHVPSWMLAGVRGLSDPEVDPMHDMDHSVSDEGRVEN